jgi:hypothetical protein
LKDGWKGYILEVIRLSKVFEVRDFLRLLV